MENRIEILRENYQFYLSLLIKKYPPFLVRKLRIFYIFIPILFPVLTKTTHQIKRKLAELYEINENLQFLCFYFRLFDVNLWIYEFDL